MARKPTEAGPGHNRAPAAASDLARFRDRLVDLTEVKLAAAEDIKELGVEMRASGLMKEDIAGVKLAVKRHFESPEKREFRETAEEVADKLGAFASSALGAAAVERAGAN